MRLLTSKIFATAAVFCVVSCSEKSNKKVSNNMDSTVVMKKFYAVDTLSPECIEEVLKAKKITLYSIYPDREVDTLPGIFKEGLHSNDQCQRIVSLQSVISMSKDADGGIAEVICLTLYNYIRSYPQDLVLVLSNPHIFDSIGILKIKEELAANFLIEGEKDTSEFYYNEIKKKVENFDKEYTLKVEKFLHDVRKIEEVGYIN